MGSNGSRTLRLGTRGSALARAQANLVAGLLEKKHVGLRVDTVIIRTEGDIDKHSPLTVIGGHGVFTSALGAALLNDEIDAAVHSAKDLPAAGSPGLRFAAFLAREDPRDVLISRHRVALAALPAEPVIGTSSRRRATQVRHARPDARIVELRGNVDTRLQKAFSTDLDGIVIAAAGIARMGWREAITEYLPLDHFVPAPGQGALAIEVRMNDALGALVDDLADPASSLPLQIERAFLRAIGAGCTTPIGAHASVEGDDIRLRCMLASDDGSRAEWRTVLLRPENAEVEAAELSQELLATVQAAPRRLEQTHMPLAGRVVVVTRPAHDAAALARRITGAGGEALAAPAIRIDPIDFDNHAVARGLTTSSWDWIAFTSRNAVDGLVAGIERHGAAGEMLRGVKIAAVGEATATALREHGLDMDLISTGSGASDLANQMAERQLHRLNILLPQGNLNRSDLAESLKRGGAEVETVQVYVTRPETALPATVRDRFARDEIDAVTFTSPSSVREFVRLLDAEPDRLAGVVIGCIGETTGDEARRLGLDWCVVAERPRLDDLVHSVAVALQQRPLRRVGGVLV